MNTESFIKIFLKSKNFHSVDINDIIESYNEDFRAYHNLSHIDDLLNYLPSYSSLSSQEIEALLLAIIFHDVVYEVGSKDNEYLSAVFFRKAADKAGLNELLTHAVFNLILTTKNHEPYIFSYPEFDLYHLSTIMIQLDLKGFEVDNFLEYELKVQKEFSSKYSWEEYKNGHIKFLQAYKSKVFTNKAKKNMDFLIEYCQNSTGYSF